VATTDEGGSIVIYYDYYGDIPPETVELFVRESEMGRLVTVNRQGALTLTGERV
jgi:hypothetical protein